MAAPALTPLPPADAIAALTRRGQRLDPTFGWQEAFEADHAAMFTVAKSAGFDILRDIHDALVTSLSEGTTFEQFARDLRPTLAAKRDGWRQWYGARDIGISRWEGIGQSGGNPASAASSAAPLSGLESSLKAIGGTATSSAQGLDNLAGNLASLTGPLAQTSDGLDKVGTSLGSNGGGLIGMIASLISSGSGASASTAVTAAGGGHIRGPGTSTSDSIPAMLSDGEFVVNAAATKKHLTLLHHLNDNRRIAAFAEGGLVGMAVPPAARQEQRQGGPAGAAGSGDPAVAVQVVNNAGAEVTTQADRGSDGRVNLKVMIDRQMADLISRPGSRTGSALKSGWGLSRATRRR